jgi:hypothetical protein
MNTLFLVTSLMLGADPEPKQIPIETPKELKEMSFLIGTWKGEGEMPGVGKYEDEFVYRWNGDYKTIIKADYKMTVKGKIMWTDETILAYDPEMKKVVGFTFGMDGSLGRGVNIETKKDEWTIEGKSVGQTPFKEWRMVMKRTGEDSLEIVVHHKPKDKWEPMMTSKYKKSK